MITPLSPQGPVTGLVAVDPAAARQAGGEPHAPIVEPGQSPRNRTDSAADPRRVPPPPRVDAEDGIRAGTPSAGTASALYRQTQETVDRARFAGLVTPPSELA